MDVQSQKESMVRTTAGLIAAFLVVVTAGSAAAQTAAAVPKPPGASLKVTLVFSRYQGEKKISSVPHTLWVTADEQRTSLRMGTQIPVASTGVWQGRGTDAIVQLQGCRNEHRLLGEQHT